MMTSSRRKGFDIASGVGTTGSAGSADPPLFGARGRTYQSSTGKRAFSVAGPRLWNSLPAVVHTTTSSFRSKFKTQFLKK